MLSQKTLVEEYKNSANLEARISLHERFSTNPYGGRRWIFDVMALPLSARLLELGCGGRQAVAPERQPDQREA